MNLWNKHVAFTEYQNILDICSPLSKISVDGFFFMRIYNDGKFIDLGTNWSWTDHFLANYLAEKYNFSDVEHSIGIEKNIDLWSLSPGNEMYIDAFKNFEVKEGLTIIKSSNKWKDIFGFYIKNHNLISAGDLVNHIDLLRQFSEYFLDASKLILDKGRKEPLEMPEGYSKLFINKKKVIPDFIEALFQQQKLNLEGFSRLTPKERQCIEGSSKGLIAKDIAHASFTSKRTVEAHLRGAREKTNCKTLSELVAYFQKLKFII